MFLKAPQMPCIYCNSAQREGACSLTKNWSTKLWALTFQNLLPRHGPLS